MAGEEISRLRVDNVRCYRHDAIVAVTLISGRFDYGADHVAIEGKDVVVRSYYRVHTPGGQEGRVINLEIIPGRSTIEAGDVIVLRFEQVKV